jgi:hypothetical protein
MQFRFDFRKIQDALDVLALYFVCLNFSSLHSDVDNDNCHFATADTVDQRLFHCKERGVNKADVPKVERLQGWVQATKLAILDTFRGEGNAGVFNHGGCWSVDKNG